MCTKFFLGGIRNLSSPRSIRKNRSAFGYHKFSIAWLTIDAVLATDLIFEEAQYKWSENQEVTEEVTEEVKLGETSTTKRSCKNLPKKHFYFNCLKFRSKAIREIFVIFKSFKLDSFSSA